MDALGESTRVSHVIMLKVEIHVMTHESLGCSRSLFGAGVQQQNVMIMFAVVNNNV